ncbi:MAG: hypothetical protein FWC62_07405 [Firmicutes bacterium]|nr:hypothetical protein [Bacillota bacterium]
MRRIILFLFILLIPFSLAGTIPAFAADQEIVSWDDFYPQTERYPDDVGGLCYEDGVGNCLLVVGHPTPERILQLRAEFRYDFATVVPCEYSYTELMRVEYEIYLRMTNPDSKIYNAGVGWHSVDGAVTGFGESGKEFRVVVGVDKSAFDRYSAEFAREYGDRVFVEVSEQAEAVSLGNAVKTEAMGGSALWLWPVIGVGLLGAFSILLWRLLRPVPALRTANGAVLTSNPPVSRKQAVAAVRDSGSAPRGDLFASIAQKLDESTS